MPIDIVVVDDDQLTLEIVEWNFRDTMTSHRLFSDQSRAMEHLCESMPAILVVDYYMPTQNGIEFLSQLTTMVDTKDCTVYLCSAIAPQKNQIEQLDKMGAQVLDKSRICDRAALLGLVNARQCLTGGE